jgi:hypothetical protein
MVAGRSPSNVPPGLADALPALDAFVDDLVADVDAGRIVDEIGFRQRCDDFSADDVTARIDGVVEGWSAMASCADGVTLRHTVAAMMSLRTLDEYRVAAPVTRHLMDWAVLLHDLAKRPGDRGRDHLHAFRSAAAAGRVLPRVGFDVTDAWTDGFADWCTLAESARRFDEHGGEYVQDNRRLPEILGGADRLYGPDAAVVLKAIALHLSVTVVAEWPARTPLTRSEEARWIDGPLAEVLLATMLADHGGWNTFDATTLSEYVRRTRAVFAQI